MSFNSDESSWFRGCCQKLQLAYSRHRSSRILFYTTLLLLLSSAVLLYVSPVSRLFSRQVAHRHQLSSVDIGVVLTRHRAIDTDVTTSKVHPLQAPTSVTDRPTSSSPSNVLSSSSSSSPPSKTTFSLLSSLNATSLSSTIGITSSFASKHTPVVTRTAPDVMAVDNYVSVFGGFDDGRGLGNQMFALAAMDYVAKLTNRQPVFLNFSYSIALDEVFDLGIRRVANLCPCYKVSEAYSLMYDRRLEDLANGSRANETRGKSILLSGFFHSWKYTVNVQQQLRRHFTFLPEVRHFAEKLLAELKPSGWGDKPYVRVGIHVRRGDVLKANKSKYGYTTPVRKYFERAMGYFIDRDRKSVV